MQEYGSVDYAHYHSGCKKTTNQCVSCQRRNLATFPCARSSRDYLPVLCGLVAVSPSPRFVASQQFAVRCGLLVERGHRGIDHFRDLNDGSETIIYLMPSEFCGLRSPPDKLTGSFSLVIELLPQPSLFPNFQQLHRRGVQPFQNLRFFAILQGYSIAVEAFFSCNAKIV